MTFTRIEPVPVDRYRLVRARTDAGIVGPGPIAAGIPGIAPQEHPIGEDVPPESGEAVGAPRHDGHGLLVLPDGPGKPGQA